MKKIVAKVIQYRYFTLLFVLFVSIFFGYQIKFLKVNSDIINSLPDSDRDAVLLKQIGEKFGGNRIGMVILEADDIFTTEVLSHVRQITDSIKEMEYISSVTSITNILDIKGGEFGLEVGALVDPYELPSGNIALEKLRNRVNSKELFKGTIVSEDGTATIIIFTLFDHADIQIVAEDVKQIVGGFNFPENIYFAGNPMLVTSISDLIRKDLTLLIPVTFLVIAIVLFLGFHSLNGVILPILTAGIAIVWTIGFMALGGYEMSMISSNIPILLLAVGSAYSIHVINRVKQEQDQNKDKAITIALTYITIPVILAAVTTAIGFVSFTIGAYLTMIRDFGLFTALGTLFSCLLSITFVPAIISIVDRSVNRDDAQRVRSRPSLLSSRVLAPLHGILTNYTIHILVVWAVLILVSIGGIFLIERSVDVKDYFKKNNPTRIAEEIMTEKFGGTKPVFVRFTGDMQSPEVLQTMVQMQEYMKKDPGIRSTQSVANLILELYDALGEGREIPNDKNMIEQLWFLIDGNEYLQRFVNEDLDEGIIISTYSADDNASKIEFHHYMDEFVKNNLSDNYSIEVTGMPFVDVTMDRSLIRSQLGSLSVAVVFVVIIVGLILGSFRRGVFATIPIIAAIIILFGLMGYFGIPLNIGTVLVASVALGIGIDYSIHIVSHYDHGIKNGLEMQKAIEDTIVISGRAIIINVASVSGGFLVLLFSEMVPLQYFGLLVAISMVGSSLGALTLLPAILILDKRKAAVT